MKCYLLTIITVGETGVASPALFPRRWAGFGWDRINHIQRIYGATFWIDSTGMLSVLLNSTCTKSRPFSTSCTGPTTSVVGVHKENGMEWNTKESSESSSRPCTGQAQEAGRGHSQNSCPQQTRGMFH